MTALLSAVTSFKSAATANGTARDVTVRLGIRSTYWLREKDRDSRGRPKICTRGLRLKQSLSVWIFNGDLSRHLYHNPNRPLEPRSLSPRCLIILRPSLSLNDFLSELLDQLTGPPTSPITSLLLNRFASLRPCPGQNLLNPNLGLRHHVLLFLRMHPALSAMTSSNLLPSLITT